MQVCKNQEFHQLTAEQLAQEVPTEEDVFHALMAWIQYDFLDDFDAREKFIPELLGLIRLPLLPPAVRILFDLHCELKQKMKCMNSVV